MNIVALTNQEASMNIKALTNQESSLSIRVLTSQEAFHEPKGFEELRGFMNMNASTDQGRP